MVAINSTLNPRQRGEASVVDAVGKMEFIYTTPEQLANHEFRAVLKQTLIGLFVVERLTA